MAELMWDQTGEKVYETGTDRGVLYLAENGTYDLGVAWNGLVSVTESPTGAEATPQYADNIKYLNLVSAEEFEATIEAFTYPEEFEACNGSVAPESGVYIGQQNRKTFGFSYRSLIGNDTEGTDYGYKIHLVYGALASPSEKAMNTVNDSPEAATFSWSITTTAVSVGTIGGVNYKPTSTVTIDSTKVDAGALAALEAIIYGTAGVDPRLPLPAEVIGLFSGSLTEVNPVAPTFDAVEDEITIPSVAGVVYKINGEVVTGVVSIDEPTVVTAHPASGYRFPAVTDDDWLFTV